MVYAHLCTDQKVDEAIRFYILKEENHEEVCLVGNHHDGFHLGSSGWSWAGASFTETGSD
jgi:hypothetical protein